MKKMRWLLSIVMAVVTVLGVSLLAVGCTDDESETPPTPATYTVTYEKGAGEEGTAPEVKSYEAGAGVTLAAATTFTKEGYTFQKWLNGTAEYDAGATFTMPEQNVTFKAKWEELPVDNGDATELKLGDTLIILGEDDVWEMEEGSEDYEIGRELTFHGKPNTTYTIKIDYEGTESLMVYYSKQEYVDSLGWAEPILNPTNGESAVVGELDETGEITVFLNCYPYVAEDYEAENFTCTITVIEGNAILYNVSFYNDPADVGEVEPLYSFEIGLGNNFAEQFEGNDEVTFPALPAPKEHQHCVGWYTYVRLAGGYIAEFTKDTYVHEDMIILPLWGDDGNLADGAESTALTTGEDGTEIVLGYNDRYSVGDSGDYEFGRVLTFTGTPNAVYTFTIEYHEDDYMQTLIIFESKEAFDAWEEEILSSFNPSVVLRMPASGTVSLFLYGGAYNPNNYSTEELTVNVKVEEGGELTWEVLFYYDYNSISRSVGSADVVDGGTVDEADIPDYSNREGFLGWYIWENGDYGAEFTKDTQVNSDLTVVAKWDADGSVERFTVTFQKDLAGDTVYHMQESVVDGASASLPPNPKKAGYEFQGWLVVENGAMSTTEFTAVTAVTENVTVVAKWELLVTSVTYSNGLEETEAVTDLPAPNEDNIITLTLAGADKFTREHYALVKWVIGSIEYAPDERVDVAAGDTVTITAVWELNEEIDLETLTLTGYSDATPVYAYPEQLKKGEILAITGDLELTRNAPATADGIFLQITNAVEAPYTDFVMLRCDNVFNNTQTAQSNADQAANNALGFTLTKSYVGFSDYPDTDWFADFNALIATKELSYKATINFGESAIIVSYYLTGAFAVGTNPTAEHTFVQKYVISAQTGSLAESYTLALGGEQAVFMNGKIVRTTLEKYASTIGNTYSETGITIGEADVTNVDGYYGGNNFAIDVKAGQTLTFTGDFKSGAKSGDGFRLRLNPFEGAPSLGWSFRADNGMDGADSQEDYLPNNFAIEKVIGGHADSAADWAEFAVAKADSALMITVVWTEADKIVITMKFESNVTSGYVATQVYHITPLVAGTSLAAVYTVDIRPVFGCITNGTAIVTYTALDAAE